MASGSVVVITNPRRGGGGGGWLALLLAVLTLVVELTRGAAGLPHGDDGKIEYSTVKAIPLAAETMDRTSTVSMAAMREDTEDMSSSTTSSLTTDSPTTETTTKT